MLLKLAVTAISQFSTKTTQHTLLCTFESTKSTLQAENSTFLTTAGTQMPLHQNTPFQVKMSFFSGEGTCYFSPWEGICTPAHIQLLAPTTKPDPETLKRRTRSIEWWYCRWPWVTPNPQITTISTFCVAFHTFVAGEHRNFKFGVRVDHNKSTDDTVPERGVVTSPDRF